MDNGFEMEGELRLSVFSSTEYLKAQQAAAGCDAFAPDDEDEWVDDSPVSCFNCQYRRWLQNRISCHRP